MFHVAIYVKICILLLYIYCAIRDEMKKKKKLNGNRAYTFRHTYNADKQTDFILLLTRLTIQTQMTDWCLRCLVLNVLLRWDWEPPLIFFFSETLTASVQINKIYLFLWPEVRQIPLQKGRHRKTYLLLNC